MIPVKVKLRRWARVKNMDKEHEFLVTQEQVQSHGGRSSLITIGQNKHSVAAVCADSPKNCTLWMPRQQRRRRHMPH
jgi:hypothetical protein